MELSALGLIFGEIPRFFLCNGYIGSVRRCHDVTDSLGKVARLVAFQNCLALQYGTVNQILWIIKFELPPKKFGEKPCTPTRNIDVFPH